MPSTPQQIVRRERFESVLRLAAPVLDLVLSVGERVSRVAGPRDEYYPIQSGAASELSGSEEGEPDPPERVGVLPEA